LIWHWQGSGKTFTMFFIASYFLNFYYATNPVIFFVVDREDLEDQHERVLKSVQDFKFKALFEKIESIKRLGEVIRILKESEMTKSVIPRGIYLTTIQKFQRGRSVEGLSDEEDREATRSFTISFLHLPMNILSI